MAHTVNRNIDLLFSISIAMVYCDRDVIVAVAGGILLFLLWTDLTSCLAVIVLRIPDEKEPSTPDDTSHRRPRLLV